MSALNNGTARDHNVHLMHSRQLPRTCRLAAFVLFCLLAGCGGVAESPSAVVIPVSSPNDSKTYRHLLLDNQMQVLLVSDAAAEKAAASLDVYVGSAGNPKDRGGLAHFLEHMLFLGTDKYPDAGEYARFISEHGGSRNAYTGFEHTNYFFDIDSAHLAQALDRFGQFFISPRFDAGYVGRELKAVAAEYQLGLKSDARRNLDVLREIVNPDHPYSILGVGTHATLADRPGQSVREDLLAFYRRYYSANLMALTVLGNESLDELEALVRGIFEAVPNRGVRIAAIDAPLYRAADLPMLVHIQPEASQRQLQLAFPMPDYRRLYHAKPLSYIGNLIGHEGEGSLLSLLKAEGLAEGLGAGSVISYRGGAAFGIDVALTEAGMEHRQRVLELLFQYLAMLKRAGPQQTLFEEQARLAALSFRFRPDVQPLRYVTGLSNDMHLFEPADVLRGNYLMDDYQPTLISHILRRYLHAENAVISVIGKDLPTDRQSHYYHTPYSVRTLAAGEGCWRSIDTAALDERLYLPAPNAFIAEDVGLVEVAAGAAPVPQLLEDTARLRIWFRQDTRFRVPRGAMFASFRSARVSDTARNAAIARLYASLLQDAVNEYTYPAHLAGLSFSILPHARGISLKLSGYTDKQLQLLARIVNSIAAAELDGHRFEDIRAALIRGLENVATTRAFRQVADDAGQLLLANSWDESELIAELETLRPAAVKQYASGFWAGTDVDLMLNGNYRPALVAAVKTALAPLLRQAQPAPPQLAVMRLEAGESLVYATGVEHDDAVLFWYLQAPDDSINSRAMAALTAQIVSADYFEDLRTEQQLGYVVSAFSWPRLQVPAVVFMVQSPTANAPTLLEATRVFLSAVAPDRQTFMRHRTALLADIQQPHKNIGEQSEYFWREIARREPGFDSRQRLAEAVQSVSREQWLSWFRAHLLEQPAALAVVAAGADGALPGGRQLHSREDFQSGRRRYQRH